MSNNASGAAAILKEAFDEVASFIDEHTAMVCPRCEKVCCIEKHGRHDNDDLTVLRALGVSIKRHDGERQDNDPCTYLGRSGCVLERWRRPYRCTYYFCEPLLQSMKEDKPRRYRQFLACLRRLIEARLSLLSG